MRVARSCLTRASKRSASRMRRCRFKRCLSAFSRAASSAAIGPAKVCPLKTHRVAAVIKSVKRLHGRFTGRVTSSVDKQRAARGDDEFNGDLGGCKACVMHQPSQRSTEGCEHAEHHGGYLSSVLSNRAAIPHGEPVRKNWQCPLLGKSAQTLPRSIRELPVPTNGFDEPAKSDEQKRSVGNRINMGLDNACEGSCL